jgi:hypothetical protein
MKEKVIQLDNHELRYSIYENTEYWFEFKYPSGSTIETRKNWHEYIRFENYIADDSLDGLEPWKYYLEVLIYDHKKDPVYAKSCEQSVVDWKKITIGVASGYKGYGQQGGDAGWIRFVLCIIDAQRRYYLQATENSNDGLVVRPILDSFKFTN